jgi:hypothetical protein
MLASFHVFLWFGFMVAKDSAQPPIAQGLSEASGVEFLVFHFGFVLASRAKRNVAFMHGEVFPAIATA